MLDLVSTVSIFLVYTFNRCFKGILLAEVRGPSGIVATEAETTMPHRTRIRFTPLEIGEYAIDLTWNRIPLPNSPIAAIAHDGAAAAPQNERSLSSLKSGASSVSSTGSGGDQKVILSGKGLARAVCGVEAEFTIDGSRAGPGNCKNSCYLNSMFILIFNSGAPEVTLTGIKSDLNVTLTNIGNNTFKASYLATSPGVYLLNVMWAER